jgi:transcriptional regulator with XRE-family HTH domain
MNFREKIDNLLRVSEKKFNSLYDLEQKSGVGTGTLRKAYEDNREPSKRTIWKFLESLSINTDWWETGKGDIYLGNSTHDHNQTDNKQKPMDDIDESNRKLAELVEGKTEYVLVPRNVLQDKYRLVPLEQFLKDKADQENNKKIIDWLLDQNEKLLNKVAELNTKSLAPQETKQNAGVS